MLRNCRSWARRELARREAEWEARGMPKGYEPYELKRRTRLRGLDPLARWIARRVRHSLVAWRDLDTGQLITMSYGPADRAYALHWWQMLRLISFRGVVTEGDTYRPTEPPRG
jgi:hypothetical protein